MQSKGCFGSQLMDLNLPDWRHAEFATRGQEFESPQLHRQMGDRSPSRRPHQRGQIPGDRQIPAHRRRISWVL